MSPHYGIGTRVRVRDGEPSGHCRTPRYLRGRSGLVVAVQGRFRDPEKLAYHKPGLPRRALYMVRFDMRELWGERAGDRGDSLLADVYEHWLEPFPG